MANIFLDVDGLVWGNPDVGAGMDYPMRCNRCGNVHDAAKVEVIARHSDCSVWKCPNCKSVIDDRPDGFGGAVKVDRRV